jgi:hypothetical protein
VLFYLFIIHSNQGLVHFDTRQLPREQSYQQALVKLPAKITSKFCACQTEEESGQLFLMLVCRTLSEISSSSAFCPNIFSLLGMGGGRREGFDLKDCLLLYKNAK